MYSQFHSFMVVKADRIVALILGLLFILIIASCASEPEEEEQLVTDLIQGPETPEKLGHRRIKLVPDGNTVILRDLTAKYYRPGDTVEVIPDDGAWFYMLANEADGQTAVVQ